MSIEEELKRVRDKEGSKSPKTTDEADEEDAREKREKAQQGDDGSGPQVGSRFTAAEIHENIRKAADEEMRRPMGELMWSALSSGLLLGFTFLAVGFLTQYFPGDRRFIAAFLGYPLGFVFVVLARHQLFTENTLEPVIPVLHRRDRKAFARLGRLWAIVLPFNLIGALIFGIVLAHTPVVDPKMYASLDHVAMESVSGGFAMVLYKGIWAGWLIAGMAWVIASTRDTLAQIVLIWLTVGPIGAFGFKHSIAGAVEAFYLASAGTISWGTALWQFEVPALIGNILGGVVLVALVNHGQAATSNS